MVPARRDLDYRLAAEASHQLKLVLVLVPLDAQLAVLGLPARVDVPFRGEQQAVVSAHLEVPNRRV